MKYLSDHELLSAYIDGELSVEEKNELEQRLNYSADLRKKLDELRKLKDLTKSAVRELPESPYFGTRFFAELNSPKPVSGGIRKYVPALGFSLLAVILMIVLKFNPHLIDNILEEQKINIASFYKENLKPLLYTANLTNEDIFNFAFSNRLPLDEKDNQVLELGYDESGKEFFEIKNMASLVPAGNNLENFAKALNLDDKQRKQVDSILESYAEDLQTQILVNDKNTLAINPNLWNYNKAIAAELLTFAAATNKNEFKKIMPAAYTLPEKGELKKYVSQVKTARDNEYIFFTPDSIFSEVYEFDKGKFHIEIEKMKKDLAKDMKELESDMKKLNVVVKIDTNFYKNKKARVDKNFSVFVDSNSCRVMVPMIPQPGIKLPMLDSLNLYLEDLAENMKHFSFKIDIPSSPGTEAYTFRMQDSSNNFTFKIPENLQIPNVDSLVKMYRFNLDSLKLPAINMDSLMSNFRFFSNDSMGFFNHQEFRKEMEELEEEMKHFREEMKELRKDINKDKKKKTTVTEPIEI